VCKKAAEVPDLGGQTYPSKTKASFLDRFNKKRNSLSLNCCGNQTAPLGATQSEKVND